MAVQAQYYPSSNLLRGRSNNSSISVLEEFQQYHHQWDTNIIIGANLQFGLVGGEGELGGGDLYSAHHYYQDNQKQQQQMLIGNVFNEEPESVLTSCCINPSGSNRKRNRDDIAAHEMSLINHHHLQTDLLLQQQQQQQQHNHQHHFQGLPPNSCRPPKAGHRQQQLLNTSTTTTAGGLQPPFSYQEDDDDNHRLLESRGTSTSGRILPSSLVSPPPPPPLAQDLDSHLLHQQNLQTDTLIKLHNEKLRLVYEETQKRQCLSLLSYSMNVKTKLEEKELELENAIRRNGELEEKVKQMYAENLNWFNVAKNNEATVSTLKSTLEQILAQNYYHKGDQYFNHHHQGLLTARTSTLEEGFGDSEEGMASFPGGATDIDAQSYCCYQAPAAKRIAGEEEDKYIIEIGIRTNKIHQQQQEIIQGSREIKRSKSWCKVCHENQVSVLMLPCRHLCLCKDCESKLDSCPICNSVKNASLQIFIA